MSVIEELHELPDLMRKHEFERVLDIIDRATDSIPPQSIDAGWYVFAGAAAYFSSMFRDATLWYRVALCLDSDCLHAILNLSYVHACCPNSEFHDGPRAVALAKRACELTQGGDWRGYLCLAAAQARFGDFDAAFAAIERADECVPRSLQGRVDRVHNRIFKSGAFTIPLDEALKTFDSEWNSEESRESEGCGE
jgi:hypothetical protein